MTKLVALALPLLAGLAAGQSNGPGFRNGNPVSSQLSQTSPTDPWGLIALMVGPQEPGLPIRTPTAGARCLCRTMRAGLCQPAASRAGAVCSRTGLLLPAVFALRRPATELVGQCAGPAWLPTGVFRQVVSGPTCSRALSYSVLLSEQQQAALQASCDVRCSPALGPRSTTTEAIPAVFACRPYEFLYEQVAVDPRYDPAVEEPIIGELNCLTRHERLAPWSSFCR